MDRKITPLLIVLIFSLLCLGLVSAENNTTDNLTSDNIEDLSNAIMPVYITDNGIEFSDGFTGFCIDSAKDTISSTDYFKSEPTHNDDLENHIKLAIIEAYKSGKEDHIGEIVSQVIKGNKEYDVVKAALDSDETVADTAVVDINNTTEATFEFEFLKSTDDSKSDCLAYKVSLKTVQNTDKLGAANDESNVETATNDDANASGENEAAVTAVNEDNNLSDDNKANDDSSETDENESTNQTVINENTTIVNKTVIVNQNNTTNINKTTIINNANKNPQNDTIPNKIMRTAGNPIFLLGLVIVIAAIVMVVLRRRE